MSAHSGPYPYDGVYDLSRAMDAEAHARVWFLRLWPGERTPYITGRRR